MDTVSILQLVILVVLLLLSAFFSSAETALTTVNKIKMKSMAEDGDKRAQCVLKVTDDSAKMLSAILIGNNVVNLVSIITGNDTCHTPVGQCGRRGSNRTFDPADPDLW